MDAAISSTYIDNAGRLITTDISMTTNQLSATTGYFLGKAGTVPPQPKEISEHKLKRPTQRSTQLL
jgi:hypothetical protein